jgi:CubicO group peptidase (beta-lactamase class C family)
MINGISRDEIARLAGEMQFSGVVSLARPADGASLDLAFGFAHRGHRVSNNAETRFAIASGCKVFAAVAIGMLIDAGTIALDTRLADCIRSRQFSFAPEVTIAHLLNHTSGVPDYFDEEVQSDYGALWRERPCYSMTTTRDFLPLFENGAMKARPGGRFRYNNAGFILLGLVVEELTGEAFRAFVSRQILQPCGMARSGYFAMDALPDNTACGYLVPDETDGRTNIFSVPSIGGADGGAFATAGDMRRFWQALLAGRLVSRDLFDRFTRPTVQAGDDDATLHYGYGVWLRETPRGRFAHVVGGDPGVSMESGIWLGDGLVVTVLSNVQFGATDMAQWLRERIAA